MSAADAVLAVDVGGSSLKGAVFTTDGRTLAPATRPTGTGTAAVDAIAGFLRELADRAQAQGLHVAGAGVVTPGTVDERTGVVGYASNLGWRDVPLRDLLTAASGLPVATGHDVRAAGLAERLFGAARGVADFVLVPLGTGVAAAVRTSGHTVTGATGAAGEFGHVPVVPDGELCPCGQRGCLEVYASGGGVARRYAARTGTALRAEEVVARLGRDGAADAVWADAVAALSSGLVTLTMLLDPRLVVLGGGFTAAGDALLVPLRERLSRQLVWRAAPEVRVAQLGSGAGRVGAAVLALRRCGIAPPAALVPAPG
ncbi:ROK family protein [Kineococcus radiotolerans]|uniref:ROK family protein n=1 Tax=Kineococcus radiotolerans (strain ATCC BAA-149 / DSM 14245 / SRS30216) TaxID=266940 RepID=A6W464_KINRD|nr:ROK family protein [Kineococcus radiotolerans]ABS01603.1 ROK family protein [Kineococcus radiotolerans SRS30216 = ATCC BAA-149]